MLALTLNSNELNCMKKTLFFTLALACIALNAWAQATIRLTDTTLMHEMRATPSPLDKAVLNRGKVSLMWPLPASFENTGSGLDGMEPVRVKKPDANKVNYRVRLSQTPDFKNELLAADCFWPFYNLEDPLAPGTWYWQCGYVKEGQAEWSGVLQFTVTEGKDPFAPPSYQAFIKKMPSTHPRILVQAKGWDQFMKDNAGMQERGWYLDYADRILDTKIQHISDLANIDKLATLDSEMKKKAFLTRESRRIVDKEEANTEVLIRSYVLTKDPKYSDAAMKRINEIISWKGNPSFVGDFNHATLLSLCSIAYDSFYPILSTEQRQLLLLEIKKNGGEIFNGFVNRLENHIADNHTWQMNLRIFTMAAFAVYGELPEADKWTDYCYNLWLARFPGLNADGAWHNGDSYFHVNIRTLIEIPFFYTTISGYDFFSDPWYTGSALYVLYQQPPFSKSAGNGSSHLRVVRPSGVRVGYADALARLTNNAYAAEYVRVITEAEPDILKKGFMAKPGDLSWFRLQNHTPLPEGKGLEQLPLSHVFPQTGIATFMSDWKNLGSNAMLTFRSSPYGSTSHALANQNAFNTFYAGKPLFYSSGHHISFTDEHSVYCHRSTRAHNTILVNGMGQKIGTEGYGWIPRSYVGKGIAYLAGDASNAYGEVVSPLWLKRGQESGLDYSPANGWDKNHLKTFRRHLVELGGADLVFIYDELEADTLVSWNYLLHTVKNPMDVKQDDKRVHIRAVNGEGVSDAYLLADDKLAIAQTDQFFKPATNWLRADDKGNFVVYDNHWHFSASSPQKQVYRFATIISTHDKKESGFKPEYLPDGSIRVGEWIIKPNLTSQGKATFSVENKKENISLIYDDSTQIKEQDKVVILKDELPELEI